MLSSLLPKRWEFALLIWSALIVIYTHRVNISVTAGAIAEDFGWSIAEQGYVLSGFYWGYTIGQCVAAQTVLHFGAKHVLSAAMLLSSVATLFVPAAAYHSLGMALFLRVLIGLFQAFVFPSIYHFIPLWIPIAEKTVMVPFMYSGSSIGNIIGFAVCSSLLNVDYAMGGQQYGSWSGCFYVFGLLGIAWVPLFLFLGYEKPEDHPRISKEEVALIHEGKHFASVESLDDLRKRGEEDEEQSIGEESVHFVHKTSPPVESDQNIKSPQSSNNNDEEANETGSVELTSINLAHSISLPEQDASTNATDKKENHDETERNNQPVHTSTNAQSSQEVNVSSKTFSSKEQSVSSRSPLNAPAHLSVKYRRYEDDHLEHEFSEPIALENLANNMIASAPSRVARVDGMSTKFPGRPRTLTIVSQVSHRKKMAEDTPWLNFVTHPVSLTLFLNSWCSGWISFTLLSEMPAFLSDALGFDLSKAGLLCVFPYVALAASVIGFGMFFEYLQTDFGMKTDTVRKTAEFVAFVLSTVCLVICGFISDAYGAYAFMIFTQCLVGAYQSGLACAYSDVAPNFSSALNTLGNTISSVAGIAGPLVVSALLSALPGIWGWRVVFFITFAQGVIAVSVWMVYQTSQPVPELNSPVSAGLGQYAKRASASD